MERQADAAALMSTAASDARPITARGCVVRRPAMGVHTRRLISESVNTVDV